jgi:hypothetical protein
VLEKSSYLFKPAPAWRLRASENRDTPPPPSTPLGQNPPTGAIINYWIKEGQKGKVTLTISDSAGHLVQRYSSNDKPAELPADRYFEEGWLGKNEQISAEPGMHRFVWDLRYPRPLVLKYRYSIAAVWDKGTPLSPEGTLVLPGYYTLDLNVNGKHNTQSLQVKLDPRVRTTPPALREQLGLANKVDSALVSAVLVYRQITGILHNKENDKLSASVADSLTALITDKENSFSRVTNVLVDLSQAVKSADSAPTQGQQAVFRHYHIQLKHLLERWQKTRAAMNMSKT